MTNKINLFKPLQVSVPYQYRGEDGRIAEMAFADPDPYFRDRRADFLGDPDRVGWRRSAVHVFTHVERGIRVLVRAFRLVYESDPADSLRDGLRAGVSDENLEYRRGRAVLPWGVIIFSIFNNVM